MLSLGAVKDGVILPSEEDRKRIITQMKVRTTLKGDKSWIQQRADKEEEQQRRSPLRSPARSRGANGGSPISPRNVSPIRRTTSVESPSQAELQSPLAKSPPGKSPSATQPSGYLIRGVFTKTIDKTAPSNAASNGSPKSAKTASLPRTSPGYKMSTEEYKKLALYNVKREPTDPHDAVRTVSPDEQKKRTEAASSVLRRTAGKERSYVFSAAKKSSGSPSQEVPSFVANRVDLEEDIGPRSRSQTVPASGWFSSRGKSINGEKRSTPEFPWSEPRMANAASATSIDTGSRTQAPKPSSDFVSTFNHFSSLKSSENGGQRSLVPGTEKRGVVFSEDSYKAKPKSVTESPTPHTPRVTISPEGSPQSRPSSHFRISDVDTGVETHRRPKVGEYASDASADFSSYNAKPKSVTESPTQHAPCVTISPEGSPQRPSSHFRISDVDTGVETHRRPKVGEYASDASADFSRSALDQKEGNPFRDVSYGSPSSRVSEFSEHQPVTTRPPPFVGDSPNAIPGERYTLPSHLGENADAGPSRSFSGFERRSVQDESSSDTEYKKVEAHLAKSGSWSSESSLSTTQSEFLRASRRDEPELDTTRSSSLSTESGVATPENQQGEYGYDSDTARPVYNSCALESERRMSSYLDCQPPNAIRSGSSRGMPSYPSSHSYSPSSLERSHGMSSYLSNQAFDSGRSYYPFRDNYAAASPRSHRVPFYKDNCDPEVASGKGLLFVKESVNSTELSSSPRYNSRSMVDLSNLERSTYSSATSLNSIPPKRPFEAICTYCGREIRNCAKITIENLKICCHEYCFRCGICHKPMGDLLDKIFIHRDIVHCDKCYEKLF